MGRRSLASPRRACDRPAVAQDVLERLVPSLNQLARPPREMLIVAGRGLPRSRASISRRSRRSGSGGAVTALAIHCSTEPHVSRRTARWIVREQTPNFRASAVRLSAEDLIS
jgi:hypothetical protein